MKFSRGDKVLIALCVLLNAGLFYYFGSGMGQGSWVVIEVDQKKVARYALTINRITHVEGPLGKTEIEINEGKVRILRSPCKLKVCIKSGYIQYADRISVCLPNRVVVRIEGISERGLDAVVS
ncbi:MAG: NusG domain II-containing protein [Nitrospinae bacterium]|nr:NusG domain II-containing protein [Nitrospinota bacterium]